MQKILLIIVIGLLLGYCNTVLISQSKEIDEIKALLTKETINEAEVRVNEYLKKNPNDVEMLVFKGNVIYSKFVYSEPVIGTYANPDESVYNSSIGEISEYYSILPKEIADSIIELWSKAVNIDKKREDIYYGICHVYSQSVQTDKVIEYLPVLKANVKLNDEIPYSFADYARNIKDRGYFDDAMRVYVKISELFPECTGIINDIAAEYYLNGDLVKAGEYFEKVLNFENLDELTLSNIFMFYANKGDEKLALSVFKRRSDSLKNGNYLLYQALLELNSGGEWKKSLKGFLDKHSDDAKGVDMAKFLISSDFDNSDSAFIKFLGIELQDSYKIQIYKYFANRIKNPMPHYYYAEALTYSKRYSEAVKAFREVDSSKLEKKDKENYYFYFAWSCYKSGDSENANVLWEKLMNSDEFYYKSAAAYFLGKYYLDKGNKEKAEAYFKTVSERATESKYATYCWNLLKK